MCFRKILEYHKFKTLALQSDAYLKTLNLSTVKLEDLIAKDEESSNDLRDPIIAIDNDIESANDNGQNVDAWTNGGDDFDDDRHVKTEPEIKEELLSDIITFKEEDLSSIINPVLELLAERNEVKVPDDNKNVPKRIKHAAKHKRQFCEECGKSVRNIKKHSLKHKPKQERKVKSCKLCGKVFNTYRGLLNHTKQGFKKKCTICGKEVKNLSDHMSRIHNQDKFKLQCALYEKHFLQKSEHTKDKPFEKVHMLCHKLQEGDDVNTQASASEMINNDNIPASDNAEPGAKTDPDDNAIGNSHENADLSEVDRNSQVTETFDMSFEADIVFSDVTIDQNICKCFFCGKGRRIVKGSQEKLSVLTKIGRDSIKKLAIDSSDSDMYQKLQNLSPAQEYYYHIKCKNMYVYNARQSILARDKERSEWHLTRGIRAEAYAIVEKFVDENIVCQEQSYFLKILNDMFIDHLKNNEQHISNYSLKSYHLKERLRKKFSKKIKIITFKGQFFVKPFKSIMIENEVEKVNILDAAARILHD